MPKTLIEETDFDCAIAPQDVGTADVTSSYVSMVNHGRAVILAKAGAVTAGKILTATPMQAKDAAGTAAKALGSAVTAAGAGGNAPADIEIEIRQDELDHANGFTHIAIKLGIDEDAKLGAAYIVRGRKRFAP